MFKSIDSKFTVTVIDEGTSKIYLQRTYGKTYLHDDDGDGFIKPDKIKPDESCVVYIGEFMDHSGDTLLAVRSHRGKLWCQIDDPWKRIVAKETKVSQCCLFKLRKL